MHKEQPGNKVRGRRWEGIQRKQAVVEISGADFWQCRGRHASIIGSTLARGRDLGIGNRSKRDSRMRSSMMFLARFFFMMPSEKTWRFVGSAVEVAAFRGSIQNRIRKDFRGRERSNLRLRATGGNEAAVSFFPAERHPSSGQTGSIRNFHDLWAPNRTATDEMDTNFVGT